MIDALFPDAQTLQSMTEFVGQYVAWGIGIAFVGWALGYVVWFIIDALRY